MKYIHTAIFAVVLCFSAMAQYEMDLQQVKPVQLNYLNKQPVGPNGKEIRVNNIYMEENGKPTLPVMGEFHYVRLDENYWRDALLKMKSSGVNIVSTYVLWSLHEETEGNQKWTSRYDLRKFVKLCRELGLKVHLRIGPYCNAEIRNGALPDWIVNNKSFSPRSNDPTYLNYTRKWYQSIYNQIRGLLYKDGGPIMAIQLENEFVKKGIVISHLMNLKKIAVEVGLDAPLYTMTHWMDSEYPKGEIVPYAGFYIETPWVTDNGKMTAATNFEFFTYNRLSDNIGTDIIKIEGDIESFDGSKSDSPFFTCEIGVGAPTFYYRRAVVPEEMAGENINLRLGTGVNLMGYYMYVGGTNPRGITNSFGTGPNFGYDYQAPIREFGTLGVVMKETKKLNYFMNDFGSRLAPMLAYLPISNKNRENLQWAVRSDGKAGYLFVSNHLYRYDRPQYDHVQFKLKIHNEELTFPRKPISIINKAYFLWPFNLDMEGVILKYATVQPVTKQINDKMVTYFFFEDDGVPAEYLIDAKGLKSVVSKNAKVVKEKGRYYIHQIRAGKQAAVEITKINGQKVRLVTLTEEESDYIWKERLNNEDLVAITTSSLIVDSNRIEISSPMPDQEISIYQPSESKNFVDKKFYGKDNGILSATYTILGPMQNALWVSPGQGDFVSKVFRNESISEISEANIRICSDKNVKVLINENEVSTQSLGDYFKGNVKPYILSGDNSLKFESITAPVIAEIEILYKNGVRKTWSTDESWLSRNHSPVKIDKERTKPMQYSAEERLGLFRVDIPEINSIKDEARLELEFLGDMAIAYIGGEPITDCYNNGAGWFLGVSRYKGLLQNESLLIRINGFKTNSKDIFLEENVDRVGGQQPSLNRVKIVRDYIHVVQ